MRRHLVMMVLAGAAAACWAAPPTVMTAAAVGAIARAGAWRTAIEIPGLRSLDKGGSAGNCAAGGFHTDGSGRLQAFVVSETNGTWRTAIGVPGSGALNAGGHAVVNSVSCASAADCTAGGDYTDGHNHTQAFVVGERNGTWGTAIRVPGSGALNAGGSAQVNSVSCASGGSCAAGGFYTDGSGHLQGFVVSETSGTWGKATRVPGLGALNKGGIAAVVSVSCGSADNCAAGGSYAFRFGIPRTSRRSWSASPSGGLVRARRVSARGAGRIGRLAERTGPAGAC